MATNGKYCTLAYFKQYLIGTTASTSGNTTTLTGAFRFALGSASSFTQYKLFEAVVFDAVPADAIKDSIASNFMAWIGAT